MSQVATAETRASAPNTDVFDGEYVSREIMAGMLKVSIRTLVRMTHRPKGLPHLTLGNRTMYRVASVRQWLAALEIKPDAGGRKRRTA